MIDFSSWSSILGTVAGLLFMTLMMVGIRLLFMQTIQKRRERENRQINERLKTLIAAYKVLGGSFTGILTVSPVHLRDVLRAGTAALSADDDDDADSDPTALALGSSERHRRVRDAVEAALSDIILLGTEDQVRLAAQAAQDMVNGNPIETAALVASLRAYIRQALDLEPIPASIVIPNQLPPRAGPAVGGARRPGADNGGGGGRSGSGGGGRSGSGGGGAAAGGGAGMGMGLGLGGLRRGDDA